MSKKQDKEIRYSLRVWQRRNGKPFPLLGKRGAMAEAFREVAKAIQWWYKGPGKNTHFMTGPHEYSDSKPFCGAGPNCVRCRQAVIARAAIIHQKNGESSCTRYAGPTVRLDSKLTR